jgi:hypothetical protein
MASKNMRNIISAVIMTLFMLLPVTYTTHAGAPIHDSNTIPIDNVSELG